LTYETVPAARPARSRALPAWPAARPLRTWQRDAADAVLGHSGDSFLASATPAAGKTTFGLNVAHRMLSEGRIGRVAVIAPTTHICRQWAADAARYGIDLEPNRPNAAGPEPRDRHGVAVTYATLAAGPAVHRRRCAELPTLLLADEPHHMGEQAAWGRSTRDAFERARFRLLLSGTPFRSDNTPIPWVAYDGDGVSSADHGYGYTQALIDGVCRPVTFHTYDGDMEWVSDGRRRRADFSVGLPAAEAARRLRTALDPEGDWVAHVLTDAHRELVDLRASDHPDAGGLVVAFDKEHAERLAARLARIAGERPEVVTSDAPDASARIARFATGSAPWLVSVLMVSEGVDIPRLRVGVYATTARTELFFRQVVGRFIRRTPTPRHQMSHLFLPSDPALKRLAGEIEEERNHALIARLEGEAVERGERGEPAEAFRALWSSARRDDDVLQTTAPGDALQLFAEPGPVASPALAAFGGATTTTSTPAAPGPSRPAGETAYERRERLREERRTLVSAISRRTGEEHRVINARVNREVGALSVAKATEEQLERANRLLEREAAR
jgi:superfamily II DNA or RNA helicase